MAITTYAELQTAIADHLNDAGLAVKAPEFIALAEARHKREIRIRDMIKRSRATLNGRYLALPSDYLEAIGFVLLTDPVTTLTEVTPFEMARIRKNTTTTPAQFTVHEEIEFNVSAANTLTGELVYYGSLGALSTSNTTNALLTRAPDAYLYAALAAAAPFMLEDARIPVWETLYARARDDLMALDRRGRRIGPLMPRVVGGTP